MAVGKCVVFLAVLTFSVDFGDAEVCVLRESCILPCSFHPGDEVLIHWIRMPVIHIHSYYHNEVQLTHQSFKGRISLFKDQISRGNASLQFTRVEVQDQGRYKCYTSTISGNKESFIDLNVEAPVRKVDIAQVGNRITCNSEGIYPEPELTWSTDPPSTIQSANDSQVQHTEQQLYNISSSLDRSDNATDLVYSCTVRTGTHKWRATLAKPTSINGSDTETTIPCTSNSTSPNSLIWKFNHSQIILKWPRTDVNYTVTEEWRQRVKTVSKSGILTLNELSSNQEGIYTCEVISDEKTYVKNTFLRIKESQGISTAAIIIIAVAALAAVIAIACCIRRKKNVKGKRNSSRSLKKESEGNSGETKELQCCSKECDGTT